MSVKVTVAPKGMGLNDFVAMQEGFFLDEGLDVEFDMKTFRGTQSSWKDLQYFDRPQDRPFAEGRSVIQGACAWGSICNASASMGKFVPDCYGVSPWGIFVRPNSTLRKPEDLKDIPIAVGLRAGSHFNVPYRLEKYLPLEHIKTVNVGGLERVSQRCSTATWKRRACCRRKSTWPSSLVCARSWRIRSTRSGGCLTTCPPTCSPATSGLSIAPKTRSTPISADFCRCGDSRYRQSSRTANGISASSVAANDFARRTRSANGVRRSPAAGRTLGS